MAETSDRLQSAPVGPGGEAELPPDAGDEYQPYRPLSVPALGGFGLSMLSAAAICVGGWIPLFTYHTKTFFGVLLAAPVVAVLVCLLMGVSAPLRILRTAGWTLAAVLALSGLGGLLTYSNTDPWLLPTWMLVLPAAGLLLTWLGRNHVQGSENTLSGLALCNWGLGVVTVFTLIYVTYYAATVIAVRYQSAAFADQWMDRVKKGDLDRAFLMTLPQSERPAETAGMRAKLESWLNQAVGPNNPGQYSEFGMKDFIRLLASGSGDARVEPLGLLSLKYEGEEYQVRYGYRVVTMVCTIVLEVTVAGVKSPNAESKGRQWYVDMKNTGRNRESVPEFTSEGKFISEQTTPARELIEKWFARWSIDDDDAYLWTLPGTQRDEMKRLRPVVGAALGGTGRWIEPGRAAFYHGGLIEADAKTFYYAGKDENRTVIPDALRKSFFPGNDKPDRAVINPAATFPLVQTADGMTRLVYDVRFLYGPEQKDKLFQNIEVDAQLVLEGDAASLSMQPPRWQVRRVDLVRARTVQTQGGLGAPTEKKIQPFKPGP